MQSAGTAPGHACRAHARHGTQINARRCARERVRPQRARVPWKWGARRAVRQTSPGPIWVYRDVVMYGSPLATATISVSPPRVARRLSSYIYKTSDRARPRASLCLGYFSPHVCCVPHRRARPGDRVRCCICYTHALRAPSRAAERCCGAARPTASAPSSSSCPSCWRGARPAPRRHPCPWRASS